MQEENLGDVMWTDRQDWKVGIRRHVMLLTSYIFFFFNAYSNDTV